MADLSRLSSAQEFPEQALQRSSTVRWLKTKATALAIAIGMLPLLGVGTAIYYFGSQSIEEQIQEARREGSEQLAATTLPQQKDRLALLLLGTSATALLSGIITIIWANRTVRSALKAAADVKLEIAEKDKIEEFQEFSDAIHSIRKVKTEADILRVSVDTTRQAIGADRVVVYALDDDGAGTVIAESVNAAWPRAMRSKIKDPCFGATYIEAYRQGRVKATDNVAEELSPCYVQQLEAFAVKANLVAPVLNGNKLFGLLIAHQCSAPRQWKQSEIHSFAQIATQVGISLDNARFQNQNTAEAEMAELFQETANRLRKAVHEQDVLNVVVEAGRKMINVDRVIVYTLDENASGIVAAESVVAGCPKTLKAVISDPCFGSKYLAFYRQGRVQATHDIYESDLTECHIKQLAQYSIRANLVTPLIKGDQLYGLLIAHQCSGPREWRDFEIQWLAQLATQTGFALEKVELLANNAELQKQTEREIEWKDFFTASTRQIHASLSPEDVLKTAVKQVRSVLKCDRVVIYSVYRESMGVIIAESVNPSFPRALGRKIEDPCFETKYIKQYENGRVRALNDVYDSGITQCYLEQLEALAVRANLVAPVLHEGKLLGLLVAHQCSGPREWKPVEIGWFQQIAVQVGYALDNAALAGQVDKMTEEAAHELALKDYFIDASRQIHASLDLQTVLETAVAEVRRVLKCDRVLVYSVTSDSMGIVIAESIEGNFPKAIGRKIEDPCFEAKYIKQYENGRVRALDDIYNSGMTQCYIDQLERLAVRANLVAPVLHEGKILGLLVAHQCSEPRQWKQLEISWFKQVAVQVGYALDNAKLIGNVNQLSQNNNLQQHVAILLGSLSNDTQAQVETATTAIAYIHSLMETAQEIVAMVHQAEIQAQQTDQALGIGYELVGQTVDHVSTLQHSLVEAGTKLKHLNLASQQITESLTLINDLAIQMNQEVIQLAINTGQTGESHQNVILETAEAVRALKEQLAATTAFTESLIAEIVTEVNAVGNSIQIGVEESATGTQCAQETYSKLGEITALSTKVEALMARVAQAAASQVQASTIASQVAHELSSFAHRASDQSKAVVQSLALPAIASPIAESKEVDS